MLENRENLPYLKIRGLMIYLYNTIKLIYVEIDKIMLNIGAPRQIEN